MGVDPGRGRASRFPFWENQGIERSDYRFLLGFLPRRVDRMGAAELTWPKPDSKSEIHSLFENAPLAWAQCDRQGNITAWNPAWEQMLAISSGMTPSLRLVDLIQTEHHAELEQMVAALLQGERKSFQFEAKSASHNGQPKRWSLWRAGQINGSDCVLVITENLPSVPVAEQRL